MYDRMMPRRDFIKVAGMGLAAGMLGTSLLGDTLAGKPVKHPNVLLIAIDDLNDWVGCLGGHPQALTPNIDKLAKEGVLFHNAHCCATVCGPSRTSLLFGIRPSRSGIYSNGQDMRDSPVLKDAVTLPEYFRQNGYTAAMYGKVFDLGDPDPQSWDEYWPKKQRWGRNKLANGKVDKVIASIKEKEANYKNWQGPPVYQQGQAIHAGSPADCNDEQMPDFNTVTRAEKFLTRKHDKPFFLSVGIVKPHTGWSVPKKYHDKFPVDKVKLPPIKEDDLDDVPARHKELAYTEGYYEQAKKEGKVRLATSSYLACVNFADAMVGKLLKALEASPYAGDTIIVLWGDNGHHIGEKKRIHKATVWEESTRIPLILAGPGIPKGEVINNAVDSVNVYPTLVDLSDLKKKSGLDGFDMVPLMNNPKMAWNHPAITTQLGKHHSVRTDRYRYIRYCDGGEELYDHKADPNEWTNLATDPKFAETKKKLSTYIPSTKTMPEVHFALPEKK